MTEHSAPDAVAALWERFRPLVQARIDTLQRFAEGDENVDTEEAAAAAHNLAGSLGSYGHREGSRIARHIEDALRGAEPLQRGPIGQEVTRLRAAIE